MFLYVVHLLGYYISYNCVFSSGCMKVQFDQSSYSTVRKSSCLVYVHLLYIALCVCVGGGGGGLGERGTGGGNLRPPSPLICKNHELW